MNFSQPCSNFAQKQFFDNGSSAFERKNSLTETIHFLTIAAFREKLHRKEAVIAEFKEEHLQLKKSKGEL